MSDTQAKVKEMAQLALLSSRISPFHEKNLKAYPQIFFDGVNSAEIEFDLQKGKDSFVIYRLQINGATNDNMEKRLMAVDKSVKHLFWKDLNVVIYINDIRVFGDLDDRK